jgi:hypothetical protein
MITMFVRKKTIKGNVYYYFVKSVRNKTHVRQVILDYLGSTPPSEKKLKVLVVKHREK